MSVYRKVCRSWEAGHSHFLKFGSKYPFFRFSLILTKKKVRTLGSYLLRFDSTFRSYKKAHCLRANICWSIRFHITKKFPKILKSCFLKKGCFQIAFLKFHNSVSFWARAPVEVSFHAKLLTDCHTIRNSISTK